MTDPELLRALRLLVDPHGGGIGVTADRVHAWVLDTLQRANDNEEMHDVYQRYARGNDTNRWFVCAVCLKIWSWPDDMGLVTDGGKARAICRGCRG